MGGKWRLGTQGMGHTTTTTTKNSRAPPEPGAAASLKGNGRTKKRTNEGGQPTLPRSRPRAVWKGLLQVQIWAYEEGAPLRWTVQTPSNGAISNIYVESDCLVTWRRLPHHPTRGFESPRRPLALIGRFGYNPGWYIWVIDVCPVGLSTWGTVPPWQMRYSRLQPHFWW